VIDLPDGARELLAPLGEPVDVRAVHGGRGGRTFVVEHRGIEGAAPVRSVVHRRSGDIRALVREAGATARAHAAGVGPEVLACAPEYDLLVTRWVEGEVLTDVDLRDLTVVHLVATALRRLHAAPVADGEPDVSPATWRERYLADAARRGVSLPPDVRAAQARTADLVAELAAADVTPVGCHADLVAANLVRSPAGIVLLDHEYAGLADPASDLANLVATGDLDASAVEVLVTAYAGTVDPALLERVRAWREVIAFTWFVWVALGDDLGPGRERWVAWAERERARWPS
jgi:thiamine kinase-like enzyme